MATTTSPTDARFGWRLGRANFAESTAATLLGDSLHARQARAGLLMVLPSALFFLIFFVYPVGNAIWVSLTSWDLVSPPRFIGLRNYARLMDDPEFSSSITITLIYTIATLAIELPLAFALALLLDRRMKARGLYQAVIFAPVVLSMVAVAMIWRAVYTPMGGLYLLFTQPFGITNVQWLNSSTLALPALVIVGVWKNVGYYMVILLAGLQAIPQTYYEAARIDGAGPWDLLRRITLPLLRPFILYVVVISIVRTTQSFSAIYTLTGGGPAGATKVLPYLIYENAFSFNKMGYASAMAVLMFIGLLALTALQFRFLRGRPQ